MVEAFLQYLQYEKNFSSHTVLSYRNDLSQFEVYVVGENGVFDPAAVNDQLIRGWMLSLMNASPKMSARSVNRKLSALKSFYRYLNFKKIISTNPTKRIVAPKTKKRLPMFFKENELGAAMDVLQGDDFEHVMGRLIIDMLYQTGVRLSELITIKDADVDFSNQSISVIGKRNKQRIIPIGAKLQEAIRGYISLRDEQVARVSPCLFVTARGEQLYPKYVYNMVHSTMRSVSTLEKCSPHVLRHTFATVLLNNDADIDVVKTALGHANLAATEVYTHTTFEQLQIIYKRAHPRVTKK